MFTKGLTVLVSFVAIALAGTSVWENRGVILSTSSTASTGCHAGGCAMASSCTAAESCSQVSEESECCTLVDQCGQSAQKSAGCDTALKSLVNAAAQAAGATVPAKASRTETEISWE